MAEVLGTHEEVPVLLAGGGLIGLSTAMFLAQHGVRRSRSSGCAAARRCRAPPFSVLRTIEMFRARRNRGRRPAPVRKGIRARRRAHHDGLPRRARSSPTSSPASMLASMQLSPCRRLFIYQPGLEPHSAQARAGGRRHTAAKACDRRRFAQDANGVTVTVRDVDTGQEGKFARQISRRRRRRAQPRARIARHSVRRPRRLL